MRRIFLSVILAAAAICAGAQSHDLLYQVKWHWGLVDLTAGEAHVKTQLVGDSFYATVHGHSIEWEGRVYYIADTLQATVSPNQIKLDYINGWYRKPKTGQPEFSLNPDTYKNILGQGTLNASASTMEAVNVIAHMLGLYYLGGAVDFSQMAPYTFRDIPYRDDSGMESVLQMKYLGEEDGCYLIQFKYSFCPYHVKCHINKITGVPVFFSAEIAIGHVEMMLYPE